ncbi:MAG: SH3 domain-containing protein [Bacteroidota bacterium]
MKQFFPLFLICLLSACQPDSQQQTSSETPVVEPPAVSSEPVPEPDISSARQAFIVGEHVNFRSEPSASGEKLGQVNSGDMVDILELSKPMSLDNSDDPCKQFPWVKFRSELGEGWVYGKFIYEIETEHALIHRKLPNYVRVGGQRFFYMLGKNFGVGASDSDGLTGCRDEYMVGLIKEDAEAIRLVPVKGKMYGDDVPWWTLTNDAGVAEEISELSLYDDGKAVVGITAYFQEGHGTYDLVLTMNAENQIVGQVENYQTFEP